jgi:methyl-accepting chemotaxis protein
MKNNQPVSNVEYVLKDTDMIVSKTDLKGVITYINEDFLRISGFAESELIGVSHNCVRHPDMPVEAFEDLWKSMKEGRPWTGYVKNRCKNGDFYWVQANVAPLYENGQCTGYISVRSKPAREIVTAAEAAYRKFREGNAKSLRVLNGEVVSDGVMNHVKGLFNKVSVAQRMTASFGVILLLLIAMGGTAYQSMQELQAQWQGYQISVSKKRILLEDARTQLGDGIHHFKNYLIRGGEYKDKFSADMAALNQTAADFKAAPNLTEAQRAAIEKLLTGKASYLKAIDEMAQLKEQKKSINEIDSSIKGDDKAIASALDELDASVMAEGNTRTDLFEKRISAELGNLISVAIVSLLFGMLVTYLIVRSVLLPVRRATHAAKAISSGDYLFKIERDGRQDEFGELLDGYRAMQIRLGFDVAETNRVASESLRIKIALDCVSVPVTVSDHENFVIYFNTAMGKQIQLMQPEMQKKFPSFSIEQFIGQKVGSFFEDETVRTAYGAPLEAPKTFDIPMGGREMQLNPSPIYDSQHVYRGRVTQWNDRTAEVAVEKEVANIVESAVLGDFTQRINMQGKEGFFKQLAEGMNKLLETSDKALEEVVRMLGALARGDLTDRITNEYHGTFGQLKDDSNATSDKLKEIIAQIREATETINTASKEIASGNTDLSQRTEQQASSLEQTAASMEQLTATVKQNADNARQANQLSHSASAVAEKGGVVVHEVVGTMISINESSRKIVDIISVIDGIAFQTNILALNAAVEAARAGEQGRGFAVVAAEVRNLAQRSAAAAKEIKNLIDDSVGKVGEGTKLVAQAGATMEEIVTAVKRVTDIMSEISAASAEQSQGIEQVNQAITQMDEVTQQNAALVEEAAAAAESLEEEAVSLARSVSVFKLDDSPQRRVAKAHTVTPAAVRKPATKPKALPSKAGKGSDEEWEEF